MKKNNYKSWNEGLTKETNSSLREASEKISIKRKENPLSEDAIKRMNDHIYETKKKNHSFNISKPEADYYNYLLSIYSPDDIMREYKDERYPYKCDFYIKSLDLFIELNLTWLHGTHPFDPNNQLDLNRLDILKKKAETSNQYKYAIKIWTISDVVKLKTLRENNLNFKIIYPNELIIQNNIV